MVEDWQVSVDEHRETLEAWADTDLPLSDDIAELLEHADEIEVAAG